MPDVSLTAEETLVLLALAPHDDRMGVAARILAVDLPHIGEAAIEKTLKDFTTAGLAQRAWGASAPYAHPRDALDWTVKNYRLTAEGRLQLKLHEI